MNERDGFYNKAYNITGTKKIEATKNIEDEGFYDEDLAPTVQEDYMMDEFMDEHHMMEQHMMQEHMMEQHMMQNYVGEDYIVEENQVNNQQDLYLENNKNKYKKNNFIAKVIGKKRIIKIREIIVLLLCLAILVGVAIGFVKIKGYNANNNKVIGGISKIAEKVTPGLSEEQLIKRRVRIEKKEEKYVPKKLKNYDNEIQPEETVFRMQPGEERSVGVTLNNKGSANVQIKSKSKYVDIIENSTLEVVKEESDSQFTRFKLKVRENAKVNCRVKIELSADNLPTEEILVIIEPTAKDTENIEMYYDMVPGMTFSSHFILSLVTKQEEKTLEHTSKIKNYSKKVLIKKDGEIRAWNVGDAVVTLNYKGKDYKIYVRVRKEELFREHNKEVTSIHFINPINEVLEVGDEYSLLAVTLPYMYTEENGCNYDTMAYYESSNTDVCTVTHGDVRAEGPGKCTITAYDKDRKVSTSIEVKVVKKKEKKYNNVLEITPEKAKEYGLSDTNGESTQDGLMKIVEDAKKQGKNKVYFTQALDLVMQPYGEDLQLIYLATETMYDFNGTKIKILPVNITKAEVGYNIFILDGVKHTVVKNLNVEGSKPSGGCVISLPDAVECTIEGCNIGYNYWNIGAYSGYYDADKMKDIKAEVFEFGNIRSDGTEGDSKCRVRSDYIDISHIDADEDFMVGNFTEYSYFSTCKSSIYDIAYYTADKKFIKKDSCHVQFWGYYKPKDAKYCRLVFHMNSLPTDGDENTHPHGLYTGYTLKIGHTKRAYKCVFKNNVLHNAVHVNLVMCGEQRCVVDGNYFYMDGDIGCDIDWEDFFNAKGCDIVKDNVFTTRYDSFACVSGLGYVFRNNAFYHQAYVNITLNVRQFRMFGNILRNIPSRMENNYDSIFANNIMGNTFYFFRHESGAESNGVDARLRVENNTVYKY